MTSPIASPQNLFAIQQMSVGGDPPSWLAWFAVSLPVSVVGVLICWLGLLLAYRPFPRPVRQLHEVKGAKIQLVQVYVVVVSVVTVGLWCANGYLAPVFGEMGVIAIIPLVAFFGTGVLNKDDFNAFLWNVVMLAMGGMALGQAVDSSGLLLTISHKLQHAVERESPWAVLCIFCGLVLVATTFVSHTVGAIVILPILRAVGEAMPDPHPKMLVMGAALMCSGAMGLPVSGFPNMNAISVVDKTGREYLRTHDFLRVGVPCSICTYGVIVSLGFVLMTYVNGW